MADLEELGYLSQPHTSAGRVPTDKAYRFYVDHLRADAVDGGAAAPRRARAGARRRSIPPSRSWRMRPLRLSQRTRMTGMLLAPPLEHTALARIELVAAGRRPRPRGDRDRHRLDHRPAHRRRRALGTEELREIGRTLAPALPRQDVRPDPGRRGRARRSPRSAVDAHARRCSIRSWRSCASARST